MNEDAASLATHHQTVEQVNRVAFEQFYRETVQQLVRFLVLQNATTEDAADIAQDTLKAAYSRWGSLTNPRAWCFRVASRDWIRRATSVRESLTAAGETPSPLLRDTPTDAWHVRHELVTALAELPSRQRQVMAWSLSGYTPKEIANELNLPNDQVRSNLRLARKALAAQLDDGQDRP